MMSTVVSVFFVSTAAVAVSVIKRKQLFVASVQLFPLMVLGSGRLSGAENTTVVFEEFAGMFPVVELQAVAVPSFGFPLLSKDLVAQVQAQVTFVFVLPFTVAVKVADCVMRTLSGAFDVPLGVTEMVTTFPVLLPLPQPDSIKANRIPAARRVFRVANFVLTSSPTNTNWAAKPLSYSSVSNPNSFPPSR